MGERPLIVIVGGADTGRAPMTAALLRTFLREQNRDWRVESAGVLGHDGDPAEPEARDAMAALNIDITGHRARSLSDELVAAAQVLLAVDSGTARVLQMRYPAAQAISLGELAGRRRDIPDPFRMQIGAWINYAEEIRTLLQAGMARLAEMAGRPAAPGAAPEQPSAPIAQANAEMSPQPVQLPAEAAAPRAERAVALERCLHLVGVLRTLPELVAWPAAQQQLVGDLQAIGQTPLAAGDLVQPYTALLGGLVGASAGTPTTGQLALLATALERLHSPVDKAALTTLSATLARWANLA